MLCVHVNAQITGTPPNGGTPPSGTPPNGIGGGGMSSATFLDLTGTFGITNQTVRNSSQVVISTISNQSSIVIRGINAIVKLFNFIVNKTGDTTSDDDSNFYGLNAAVVAHQGATLNISNSVVTSNSQGSNGIFSTGSGSIIYVSNVTIHTYSDSSRGLDATQLGYIQVTDVTITSQGAHCAGLANDRGTGTIVAMRINILTSGQGSPVIYCTGNITATQVTGYAEGAEAVVVEGSNNITLLNSNISGSVYGVMLYQSTSGDAQDGTAIFNMTNSYLTTTNNVDPLFYVTNTDAIVYLTNVTLQQNSGLFLVAGAGSWRQNGSNGGKVTFTASQQNISDDIQVDYISTLSLMLMNKSYFTGTINKMYNAKMMTLTMDASSTWNVTGTSYLTSVNNANRNMSNIIGNGFTVYYYANGNSNASSSLEGLTYNLTNGGFLKPVTTVNNQTANAFVPSVGVQIVNSTRSGTLMEVLISSSPISSSIPPSLVIYLPMFLTALLY